MPTNKAGGKGQKTAVLYTQQAGSTHTHTHTYGRHKNQGTAKDGLNGLDLVRCSVKTRH